MQQVHSDDEIMGWELFGHRSVRQGEWKIVWDQALPEDQRRWQFFNLKDDPFEQMDLSTDMPEKFQEMVADWRKYERDNRVIY